MKKNFTPFDAQFQKHFVNTVYRNTFEPCFKPIALVNLEILNDLNANLHIYVRTLISGKFTSYFVVFFEVLRTDNVKIW